MEALNCISQLLLSKVGAGDSLLFKPEAQADILGFSPGVIIKDGITVIAMTINPCLGFCHVHGHVSVVRVNRRRSLGYPRSGQGVLDSNIIGTIKNGGQYLEAQFLGNPAQVCFQDLTDVHP